MRLDVSSLLIMVATLVAFSAGNDDNQCVSSILNTNAPLRNASPILAKLSPTFDYDKTMTGLTSILNLLPSSVEKCLANYQGQNLGMILNFALKRTKCMIALKKMSQPMDQLKKMMKRFPQGLDASFVDFLSYLKGVQHESYATLCEPLTDHLEPCLTNLLPVVFTSFQSNSNGCCTEMLSNAEKSFGQALADLMPQLFSTFLDSICSEKQMASDQTQLCSYSIIQTFVQPSLMQFLQNIQASLQIPNDQACRAFQGAAFDLSTPDDGQYSFGEEATLSGCSQPLDNFMSTISSFPIVKNSDLLHSMFQDQMCMEGDRAIPAVKKSFPPTIAILLSGLIRGKCLHVANGYSTSCNHSDPVLIRNKVVNDDGTTPVVQDPGVGDFLDATNDDTSNNTGAARAMPFLSSILSTILILVLG